MPYDGLFSFLHYRPGAGDILAACVSMPYDGLFSFLPDYLISGRKRMSVSMPYDGLFSFLPIRHEEAVVAAKDLCQCPMTGFFHFYEQDQC